MQMYQLELVRGKLLLFLWWYWKPVIPWKTSFIPHVLYKPHPFIFYYIYHDLNEKCVVRGLTFIEIAFHPVIFFSSPDMWAGIPEKGGPSMVRDKLGVCAISWKKQLSPLAFWMTAIPDIYVPSFLMCLNLLPFLQVRHSLGMASWKVLIQTYTPFRGALRN